MPAPSFSHPGDVSNPKGRFPMIKFVAFLKDESGASAAEYALILAVIGAGIVAGALFLGGSIGNSLNSAGTYIAGKSLK